MNAYVDMAYVKAIGSMPPADIDAVESVFGAGTFVKLAQAVTRLFDAKLYKRYATPFGLTNGVFAIADVPEVVKINVTHVVCAMLWQKRGHNPGSAQDEQIEKNRLEAMDWLKEAADSKDGLIELPLRENQTIDVSAVTKGGPIAQADVSPYDWIDAERDALAKRG